MCGGRFTILIKILKTSKFLIQFNSICFSLSQNVVFKTAYLAVKIYVYICKFRCQSGGLILIIVLIFQQVLANYIIPKLPTLPVRAVGDWCIQCNAPHTDYAFKTEYCFTQIQFALVNNALLITSGINAKLKTQVPQIKVDSVTM